MSRRRTIHLEGVEHKAPIPSAAVVGGILMSSAIGGRDAITGEYSDDPKTQVTNAFSNVLSVVELAGGTRSDIVRLTVHLRNRDDRRFVDDVWLDWFPDESDRPARHVVPLARPGHALIQLEIVAVLESSRDEPR